jgi:5-(carboxyamino)imidazole ribonucleotide synthase
LKIVKIIDEITMLKSFKENEPMTLGILGGGQLAKMLALDAYRLGLNVAVIDKESCTPAGDMTQLEFAEGWTKEHELENFAMVSDIITLENEFIDPQILRRAGKNKKLYPSPETMELVQDKFIQKRTFQSAGIPVPVFAEINNEKEALDFGTKNGYPFLLKTRKLGYDGYGNFTVKTENDVKEAFEKFAGKPLLAEKFVNFTKELAVMAVRSSKGETVAYPCVETIQENHICHIVIAPAQIDEKYREQTKQLALKCVESIDGVGVFGVEMFLCEGGEILINEIAPRPHNSGHYTIEACRTSQYENCIRAVCGLPLGSTEMYKPAAVMINLLGKREGSGVPSDVTKMLEFKNAKLHLYNKKTSRKGRKMGHITCLGDDAKDTLEYALNAAEALVW